MATKQGDLKQLFASVGSTKPQKPAPGQSDKDLLWVDVDNIRASHHNPREIFDEAEMEELKESILSVGVLNSVTLRYSPNTSAVFGVTQFELIDGERRWRAAKKAGLKAIPAQIRNILDEDQDVLSLIANVQNAPLSLYEQCQQLLRIERQVGKKMSVAEITRLIGKDREWVPKRLKAARAPDALQDVLKQRPDSLTSVNLISSNVTDPVVIKRLAVRLLDKADPATSREIARTVRDYSIKPSKAKTESEEKPPPPVETSQGQGMKVGGRVESTPAPTEAEPFQIPSQSRNSTEAADEEEGQPTSGHSYAEAQNAAARASTPVEAEKIRGITEAQARDRYERAQGIDTTPTQPRAATTAALAAVDAVRAGTLDAEAQMAELGRIWREWAV